MPTVNIKTLGLKKRYRFEDPNIEWVKNGRIYVGVACFYGQSFNAVFPYSREIEQLIKDEQLIILREYTEFAIYDEVFENMIRKSLITYCRNGESDIELPLNNFCQQIIVHPATPDTRYTFTIHDRDEIVAFQRNNLIGEYNELSIDLPLSMTRWIRITEASRDEEFIIKMKFERALDMTKTGHQDRGFHTGRWIR